MFFGKSERKRSSMLPALVVGALAVIGAVSLTQKGKALMKKAKCKMQGMGLGLCGSDCDE